MTPQEQKQAVDAIQNIIHRLQLLSQRTHVPIPAIIAAWDAGRRMVRAKTPTCEKNPFSVRGEHETTERLPDIGLLRDAIRLLGVQ